MDEPYENIDLPLKRTSCFACSVKYLGILFNHLDIEMAKCLVNTRLEQTKCFLLRFGSLFDPVGIKEVICIKELTL